METIDKSIITKLLTRIDAGLCSGNGTPDGEMCVEEAVSVALGESFSDEPSCVHPVIRDCLIQLNDADWSSNQARGKGMRRLAVLQLGTNTDFDDVLFAKKLAIRTCQVTIARVCRDVLKREDLALACKKAATLEEVKTAAYAAYTAARTAYAAYTAASVTRAAYAAARTAGAAARTANSAAYAAANSAAYAAARTADAAARTADAADAAADAADAADAAARAAKDEVLTEFAGLVEAILTEMDVPGVQFLPMLEK